MSETWGWLPQQQQPSLGSGLSGCLLTLWAWCCSRRRSGPARVGTEACQLGAQVWPSNRWSWIDPVRFSCTCSADEPLPDVQFYQRQYYPADYATREYLSHPNCQPSPDVSPSSDGKIQNTSFPVSNCWRVEVCLSWIKRGIFNTGTGVNKCVHMLSLCTFINVYKIPPWSRKPSW